MVHVLYVAGRKAEKEACHAVLHAGVSVAGCELCPLAGVRCGGELARERPFSLRGDLVL